MLFYRKYYSQMKSYHREKWLELMNRDPAIETAGEWIRWPVGSVYLLLSVFKKKEESYNDVKLDQYKRITVISFTIFIVSFIILLIISALLPKL